MKDTLVLFLLVYFISNHIFSQNRPVSQIEGVLEVYDNLDITSIYMGRGISDSLAVGSLKNTILGYFAGHKNTSGGANSFFGYHAGEQNSTGNQNTFLGKSSGSSNTIGRFNTYIGASAGYSAISALRNTFTGYRSGRNTTSGGNNSFYGANSGTSNTSGFSNSFYGPECGESNTTGHDNSFYGWVSGNSNVSGDENSFFGVRAGFDSNGSGNTMLGFGSGHKISSGDKNIVIGHNAGPTIFNEVISNRLYVDVEESDTPLIYGDFDNDRLVINGSLDVQEPITGNITGTINGIVTADSILSLIHLGVNNNKGITFAENENPVFGIIYDGDGEGNNNRLHLKRLLGGTQTITTFTGHGTVGIGVETPHALLHVQGAVDAFLGGGGHIMTGSEGGINLVLDNNEIIARNDGQASKLFLNKESGEVVMGGKVRVADDVSSAEVGQIRYNTATNDFEGYDGTIWYSLTTNKSSFASSARSSTISNKSRLNTDYQKLILDNKKSTIENSKLMKFLTETIISLRLENTNLKNRLDKLENH